MIQLLAGTLLDDRYRVEAPIARGNLATVYRGTDTATGCSVALKVLHPELSLDAHIVEQFRREARILLRLESRHTVAAYGYGESPDGTRYIAMELLVGETLRARFDADGPLPWRKVLLIMRAVCMALVDAHGKGITHRAVEPANVHLGGVVKVFDFGLAKSTSDRAPITYAGDAVGSLGYVSPEQLICNDQDGRTDIYALGATAYEMLTGQLPFPETSNAGLIGALLSRTPARMSTIARAAIPEPVDALVRRCLACDPEDRFADVIELMDDIEHLLEIPVTTARTSSEQIIKMPPAHSAA